MRLIHTVLHSTHLQCYDKKGIGVCSHSRNGAQRLSTNTESIYPHFRKAHSLSELFPHLRELYIFVLEQTVAGFLGWDDKKTWVGQNVSTFLGASFPQQLHTEASAVQYNIHSPTDRTCSTNSCRLPRCLPWTKSKVTDFQSAA